MGLSSQDRKFALNKISYLEFKRVEMDRVLTRLFERIEHNGYPSILRLKRVKTIDDFVGEFLAHPEWFTRFGDHREIVKRWVETHLLDLVNRGRAGQAVAAPRPLHGYTYRFRNAKQSRDYGAAQHLYETFWHARDDRGKHALEHLKTFFFQGQDQVTKQIDSQTTLDVETQALLRLMEQVQDAPNVRAGRDSHSPLCIGAADLMAEDVMRLLFYQRHIPRSVMVEYLKILLAFHMALYHLRLLKLLPAMVRHKGVEPTCTTNACPMSPRNRDNPHGDCPYQIAMFVDVVGLPDSDVAALAEHSADTHIRRIPAFVKAHYLTKKLDEFAASLMKQGKIPRPKSGELPVREILQLLEPLQKQERDKFFGNRMYGLVQDSSGKSADALDPEAQAILDLKLPDMEAYVEILVALRGTYYRKSILETLETLLLKNRPGALITQRRTKNAPRRFSLDSRLLEVLLQIAVLKPDPNGTFYTGELRIDTLLKWLRERYGLYIDRLPQGEGFSSPSITDRAALRANAHAFTERLREVGFYRDLSDAYVSQTVTPRYQIDPVGGAR